TQGDSIIYLMLSYFSIFVFIIYMIVGLFLFPVYVNYKLKTTQYFKQAFFIVMLRPMEALMTASGFIVVYTLMYFIPVFIFFFGMSLMGLVTMWTTNQSFIK